MSHQNLLRTGFFLSALIVSIDAGAQAYPPAPPGSYPAPPPGYPPQQPTPYTQPPAQPQPEPPPGWAPPGYAPQYRYTPMPMELRYVEGRPIPAGYHLETRARKGLVVSGSIILGVPYFLSLSVAASSKYDPDRWLYAPLVGPFIDLATRKESCQTFGNGTFGSTTTCQDDSSERFFLMADGLMQVAGTTMLILGLVLPQQLLVRDDAPYIGDRGSHFSWAVAPTFGRSSAGLGLAGTF